MRVLLSTFGSRGDVEPVVALAVALRGLGVEARVCAPPDEEFVELLDGARVPLVPMGPGVRALVTGAVTVPPKPHEVAAELVAGRFATLGTAAEGCDAVVATGMLPVGVRSVCDKLGVRYVYACFHPFELPSPHYPPSARPGIPTPPGMTDIRELWRLDAQRVNALYHAPLNAHRAGIGLPPVDNVRDQVFGDRVLMAADPVLAPWQDLPDVDVVQTGAWLRPDERPLPADLVEFLNAGTPPVYVGFGSMLMRGSNDLARVVLDTVRAQGRRVLVGRGWADLALSDGRGDTFTVGEVNQQHLFRHVAAVVHHGGAGTTTTAARAGAPQVIVPQLVDQPYWARRIAELGIGAAHEGPTPTTESLSAALATALAPATAARAKAVADTVRPDGARVAAELLVGMITADRAARAVAR